MANLLKNDRHTNYIPLGDVLHIDVEANSSCLLIIIKGGAEIERKALKYGRYKYGPYTDSVRYDITCFSGRVTVSILPNAEQKEDSQIIRTLPTLRAKPFGRDGLSAASAMTITGGGVIEIDDDQVDPSTGLSMAKVTIPAGVTTHQQIDWLDLTPWQMWPDDVWMIAVYLPNRDASIQVQVMVSDQSSMSTTNNRLFSFSANQLQKGFNLLTALHVESTVAGTTYGVVGTTTATAWVNTGDQTNGSQSKSIRVRVRPTVSQGTDTVVYLGAVHTAPAGWAKGAIMWMADDAWLSFYDLAIPVIESFGWKSCIAMTSNFATDPGSLYIPIDTVKLLHANGHEIWGHLRAHENMSTATTAEKTRAIKNAAQFWRMHGITTAQKFIAWPNGAYNDEAITIAKAEGCRLAASVNSNAINPLIAGSNPYYLNRMSVETSNSWSVDSMINGTILRGEGMITYMHKAIAGGSGSDTYPGAVSFYVDHLQRWCELVAEHEAAGRVVVTTPVEYFKMLGIDPYTHDFAE